MIDLPINPITGKHDGILFTFGNSEVSIVLAKRLLALPDSRKFYKVTSKLADYTTGLKLIASLPDKSRTKGSIALMWRAKYLAMFENMITVEEGQTFLQNLAKTRYKEIISRA